MRTVLLSTGLLLITIVPLFSQSVENIVASFSGDKVEVTYDLIATASDQKFTIELFSSVNNYNAPLTAVTGDVGNNVLAGRGKKIVWSVKNELDQFEGDVTFEIRALVITPSIEFVSPIAGASLKKGRSYDVKWKGVEAGTGVELQLIRNGVLQNSLTNVSGNQDYSWLVPESSRPGGNYQFKIVTGNQKTATSGVFKITRKLPLFFKIAPVLAIGGAVAVLSGGGGSGGGGGGTVTPPVDQPLPAPPSPPN